MQSFHKKPPRLSFRNLHRHWSTAARSVCCVCTQSSPLKSQTGLGSPEQGLPTVLRSNWRWLCFQCRCPATLEQQTDGPLVSFGAFFHSVASYFCYFVIRTLVSCFLPSLVFFSTKKYFVVYDLKTKNCVFCDLGISFFIFTEGDFTKSFPLGVVLDFDIFWDLNFLYLFLQISIVVFFFLLYYFLQRRLWAFLFLLRELGSTAK